jgi:hypothetical protein
MKQHKGLSDEQLIKKYEAGSFDLGKAVKKAPEKYVSLKRIVGDRAKKKNN